MPLHLRLRGAIWYAGGTIRIGKQSITVPEHSTGTGSRAGAEDIARREEARIRADTLDGPAGRARRTEIAAAFREYLSRAGGVSKSNASHILAISEIVGGAPITEAPAAWQTWLRSRGDTLSPASIARWRASFTAALRAGCTALGLPPPPRIPTVREPQHERVAHLHDDERRRLLAAYNPHAACPVLLMAYGGLRTQEALQLDWRHVNFRHRTLTLDRTKSGRVRVVPMHRRVDALLFGLWHSAGQPSRGLVFVSSKGNPYTDTRGDGGNPLSQAHATACEIAGVTDFRPHDWRHDFATRFLGEGGDIRSLMQIMGWSSPRMVQRYVTYRVDHLAAVLDRVG